MSANNSMLNEPDLEAEDSDHAVDVSEEIDAEAVVEYPMLYHLHQPDDNNRLLQNLQVTTRPTVIFIENESNEPTGWPSDPDEISHYSGYFFPEDYSIFEPGAALSSYYMINADEISTSEDENEEEEEEEEEEGLMEPSSEEESDEEDSIEVFLHPFDEPNLVI